jgi:hypothetical protein
VVGKEGSCIEGYARRIVKRFRLSINLFSGFLKFFFTVFKYPSALKKSGRLRFVAAVADHESFNLLPLAVSFNIWRVGFWEGVVSNTWQNFYLPAFKPADFFRTVGHLQPVAVAR